MKIDGHRVRAARHAKKLTREQLAVEIGVSHATISRVERGLGDVAAGTAFLISQTLNVPLEELFTENGAAA